MARVPNDDDDDDLPGIDRLLALTDGVVAIALTLLVLQLQVPITHALKHHPDSAGALWQALNVDVAELTSYLVSFVVIAQFWLVHHRVLRGMRGHSEGLAWRNFGFLLSLTLMPFTSDLIGRYGTNPLAITFFGHQPDRNQPLDPVDLPLRGKPQPAGRRAALRSRRTCRTDPSDPGRGDRAAHHHSGLGRCLRGQVWLGAVHTCAAGGRACGATNWVAPRNGLSRAVEVLSDHTSARTRRPASARGSAHGIHRPLGLFDQPRAPPALGRAH